MPARHGRTGSRVTGELGKGRGGEECRLLVPNADKIQIAGFTVTPDSLSSDRPKVECRP